MPANVNPDVYLLYEYSPKTAFTVRMKYVLDEHIDEDLLRRRRRKPSGAFPTSRFAWVLTKAKTTHWNPTPSHCPCC